MSRRSFRQFFRPDVARDVDEELRSHLELYEEELVARGIGRGEARARAVRRFGDVAAIAQACRRIDEQWYAEQRRASMWRDLRQDVGFALRMLARTPGFTAVAIVTLALGIGATTTIFSLANWTLLRPVPGIERPDEVRQIWVGTRPNASGFSPAWLSYPNLLDSGRWLKTVDLVGLQATSAAVSVGTEPARTVPTEYVSASYFPVLGVSFGAGRAFTAEEDRPGAPSTVAVVSQPFAKAVFGGASGAVGRTLTVNGVRFTVVGVAARGFEGIERIGSTSVWLPGAAYPMANHMRSLRFDSRATGGFYKLVGRLRADATWPQAEAELGALAAWLVAEHPKENAKFQKSTFHVMGPIGGNPLARQGLLTVVTLMTAVSGLVLLIACSNVASLLLMRGIGRRSEVAVRTALGAGRLRLVRQHLTEGVVLWLCGGAGAGAFTWLMVRLIDAPALLNLRTPDAAVPLDWRVAVFAACLSLSVGLLFSVVPALRAARVDPSETLKEGSATVSPSRLGVGSALSAFQLATSLTLVIGSLLLMATIRQLGGVDVGFDPRGVHAFSVRPGSVGYTAEQAAQYREEFTRRLLQVPGIERVATAVRAPFVQSAMITRVAAADGETQAEPHATEIITAGYFETLRIPLLKGRLFTEDDLRPAAEGTSRPVVVVSAALARQLFGTEEAVGRGLEYRTMGRQGKRYEIIGVVGDVRFGSLTAGMDPMVYEPAGLSGPIRPDATFVIRGRPGVDVAAQVHAIGAALNPALPVTGLQSMSEAVADARRDWVVLGWLMVVMTVIAAVLAAVGLYGVVAFGVASRRREFGIRLALGASAATLMALVLRRTAIITAIGLAAGAAGAVFLSRMLESWLFGVTRFDPRVWTSAALILVATALLASWLPARRAATTDTARVLRS